MLAESACADSRLKIRADIDFTIFLFRPSPRGARASSLSEKPMRQNRVVAEFSAAAVQVAKAALRLPAPLATPLVWRRSGLKRRKGNVISAQG